MSMRVLFFGNNWVGWQVLQWLKGRGENVIGLVVHPEHRRRYGKEIIEAAGLGAEFIFDGSQLRQSDVLERIRSLRADIGVVALFGYILRQELLDLLPAGCLNVHSALLPYNRGAFPNVWSIVDGTEAGATIHYVDAGIDTGDIVAQRKVDVEPIDTGETLYRRLEEACVSLFAETWPKISAGLASRTPQPPQGGTFHTTKDVEGIDRIELDQTYKARRLIDIIRARTFPPHSGAYFLHNGKKVFLRLELLYEDQIKEEES
jgi:methionyl-tRNA formyltransferase